MLVHILAIAVGLGSILLYLAAFFFPEVHRKHDFFWSGVGCFYALVLWVDAGQISTTEFMGHFASVTLVAWFGWQTLQLRRKRTPRDLQTPLTDQSWRTFGQEVTTLGVNWLRRTPLSRFLPEPSYRQPGKPLSTEVFRASALKQVDYEFLDDLPPGHSNASEHAGSPSQPQDVAPTSPQPVKMPPAAGNLTGLRPQNNKQTQPTAKTSSKPKAKPTTLLEKGFVIKDWLVEVMTTATAPKPKKPVIVIPPREPAADAAPVPPDTEPTETDQPQFHQANASPPPTTASDLGAKDSPAYSQPPPQEGRETSPTPSNTVDDPEIEPTSQNSWEELDNWSDIERQSNTWQENASTPSSPTLSSDHDAAQAASNHESAADKPPET